MWVIDSRINSRLDAFVAAKRTGANSICDYKDSQMESYNPHAMSKLSGRKYRVVVKYNSMYGLVATLCEIDRRGFGGCVLPSLRCVLPLVEIK